MIGTKRGILRFWRAVLVVTRPFLPVLFLSPACLSPACAQDNGHLRVQFGDGSGWSETWRRAEAHAPLPDGPARANYALTRNAQSGAPQERLRLKPMNFDGM